MGIDSDKVTPDLLTVSNTVKAMGHATRWEMALQCMGLGRLLHCQPDVVCYGIALHACSLATARAQAIELLLRASDDDCGLTPVALTAALFTCEHQHLSRYRE